MKHEKQWKKALLALAMTTALAQSAQAADTKISAMTSGAPAQSGDAAHFARSGADYKLTVGDVSTYIIGQSGGITLPLSVANGGTGAANAASAWSNLGNHATVIPFHVNASSFVTWTSMPAAETAFNGSSRIIAAADLTGYSACRLVVEMGGTAGATGSKIIAKYSTTYAGTTVASYSNLGTSEISVAATTANTLVKSSWIALAAGAQADIYLILTGSGGDGSTSPNFGNIFLQCR
jgi:hypothetical protein